MKRESFRDVEHQMQQGWGNGCVRRICPTKYPHAKDCQGQFKSIVIFWICKGIGTRGLQMIHFLCEELLSANVSKYKRSTFWHVKKNRIKFVIRGPILRWYPSTEPLKTNLVTKNEKLKLLEASMFQNKDMFNKLHWCKGSIKVYTILRLIWNPLLRLGSLHLWAKKALLTYNDPRHVLGVGKRREQCSCN
jgi:hypothetical protein